MKTLLVLTSLVLAAIATPADPSTYRRAKVLRVVPHTKDQFSHLHQLLLQGQYDFWKEPRALGSPVDIMATLPRLPELMASLVGHGLEVEVQISDVGQLLEEQTAERLQHGSRAMDWTSYHDYNTITAWMESLAAQHPDLCTLEDVGQSYEGRKMYILTVGKGGANNPGIIIDGGIHAREWISPATVTYIINELVTNNGAYTDLLSKVNFYFMPVINPDGYAYTFSDDRLWRKTRSDTGSALGCKGVDANRNWDFHWNEVGASDNHCSEVYAGPKAFSEVEMKVVSGQIQRFSTTAKVYLTFHSYSQMWMYPWGYTYDLPTDWKDLDDIANDAVKALTAVHGTKYVVGSSSNTIYPAAGGSDDWAKGVAGVKYSYTVELRDQGTFGFLLPAKQIIPCGEETLEAVLVFANFLKDTYSK